MGQEHESALMPLSDSDVTAFITGLLESELSRLRRRETRWRNAALDCLESIELLERERGDLRACRQIVDELLLDLRAGGTPDRDRLRLGLEGMRELLAVRGSPGSAAGGRIAG